MTGAQGVAPTQDPWITQGQCIEQHGAGEAFLPVLDALGRLARGAGGAQLIELLRTYAPMWLVQLPAFLDGEELETLQRKVHGASRERMLREMADALERLAAEQPVILALEDLHWSDVSTLDLLAFLARRKESARLLVIGTYRPVEMLSEGHPLQSLMQELYAHGRATELPLGGLNEADVAAYLEERFSAGVHSCTSLQSLARTLYQRTGGNPLFLVSTVDELVAQRLLTQTENSWTLQGEVADVGIADSIRHLVSRQRGRLSSEERQTLEAASVAGMEFSASAVAAALTTETITIEQQCDQLAARQHFLRRAGVEAWPDGTLAARYSFLHAVYQQLWHERVSPTQLQHYHRYIGERKERAYGERYHEIAAELAVHFEQARDYRKAVQYLQQAGQNALQRSANAEAIRHLNKGLELLQILPDTPERIQQELRLLKSLGPALINVKGYAAPEVEHTYARAYELCQQGSTPHELIDVLPGLQVFYLTRGEVHKARDMAEQSWQLAQHASDPTFLRAAHAGLGEPLLYMGELTAAREHLEQAWVLYDPQEHNLSAVQGWVDPGVWCLSYLAMTLSLLGYPDQAQQRVDESLILAEGLSHPYSLAAALIMACLFHCGRREWRRARERTEEVISLSTKQGFPDWLAYGKALQGRVLVAQGQVEEGIVQMQQGLTSFRATGSELAGVLHLPWLATAYVRAGRVKEGLAVLAEAQTLVDATGARVGEVGLYVLKGWLLLACPGDNQGEVEACFRHAIAIALRQSAKSLELGATVSLARLWQQQGKKAEARKMLAEIYGWFTEGFDTKDLQEAEALLEELQV